MTVCLSGQWIVQSGSEGTTSRTPPGPPSARSTWFIPHHFLASCSSSVWQSFPSAGRLLSHSHHVIPFPVSHQEFWPFSLCDPSGRQQATELLSTGLVAVFGGAAPVCSAMIALALALAGCGRPRQAVTLQTKDSMTLSLTSHCCRLW